MKGKKLNHGGSVYTGPSRGAVDSSDLSTDKPRSVAPVDYLAEGSTSKRRCDRPGRKRGGRAGADLSPLSSAAVTVEPPAPGKASGGGVNWIQGAIKHPGALHKALKVPEGKKIPEAKLEKAEKSSNPKLAKRARLAETLKGLHK